MEPELAGTVGCEVGRVFQTGNSGRAPLRLSRFHQRGQGKAKVVFLREARRAEARDKSVEELGSIAERMDSLQVLPEELVPRDLDP